MKLERIAVISTVALALGTAGCARDREQAAKSAQTELTSEQMRAQQEQAALEEQLRQEQARAQQTPMSAEERAKLQSEQAKKRAEMQAEQQEEIGERQKSLTEAQAALEQERKEVETKARERLAKSDAKANELRGKSTKLSAAKKSQFDSNWRSYTVQRNEVEARLRALSTAPPGEMKAAKQNVERALDSLESSTDKLDEDM